MLDNCNSRCFIWTSATKQKCTVLN